MTDPHHGVILVVDDDEDLLTLVAMVLSDEGYTVATARDGLEGLREVEHEMPDLILLDMKMPVMNGWRFASELRARYPRRAPIIVLTAAEDARKRAEEIGACDWVAKPFELSTLRQTVADHVGDHSPGLRE